MLRITEPGNVDMLCTVQDETSGALKKWNFEHFVAIGFEGEEVRTVLAAADLRDLIRAHHELTTLCEQALEQLTPEARLEIEADLAIESSLFDWRERDD